jgi:hypothetical protein
VAEWAGDLSRDDEDPARRGSRAPAARVGDSETNGEVPVSDAARDRDDPPGPEPSSARAGMMLTPSSAPRLRDDDGDGDDAAVECMYCCCTPP